MSPLLSNAILIIGCLQWDFVGPLGRFDPLPNALHIGHQESWRLMGEDPAQRPVARVIAWAHQQSDAELRVIHVRDWHDRGASIGDFVAFLGGTVEDAPLSGFSQKHPELEIRDATEISTIDRQLLRYLFRGCRKLRVRSLDGGFSGNRVLATQSTDLHGHEQIPHVVKIGAQGAIGQERTAFERIEAVLGNAAPRIADFADWQERGAIKYRYAAMGDSASQSFQKIYATGAEPAQVQRILDAVFVEQLGRLYQAAELERCDLLEYYQYPAC